MFYRIDVNRSIEEKMWVIDSDDDLDALKKRPPYCDGGNAMILHGAKFLTETTDTCADKGQLLYTHFYEATSAEEEGDE